MIIYFFGYELIIFTFELRCCGIMMNIINLNNNLDKTYSPTRLNCSIVILDPTVPID